MSDDSDSNLTQQDLRSVGDIIAKHKLTNDEQFWKKMRRRLAVAAIAMLPIGGGTGAAWSEWGPDSTVESIRNRSMKNTLHIDKLTEEVVRIQGVQVEMPQYIVDSVLQGKLLDKLPPAMAKNAEEVEDKKVAAAAGKLLEVSDDEIQAALDAEADG